MSSIFKNLRRILSSQTGMRVAFSTFFASWDHTPHLPLCMISSSRHKFHFRSLQARGRTTFRTLSHPDLASTVAHTEIMEYKLVLAVVVILVCFQERYICCFFNYLISAFIFLPCIQCIIENVLRIKNVKKEKKSLDSH